MTDLSAVKDSGRLMSNDKRIKRGVVGYQALAETSAHIKSNPSNIAKSVYEAKREPVYPVTEF